MLPQEKRIRRGLARLLRYGVIRYRCAHGESVVGFNQNGEGRGGEEEASIVVGDMYLCIFALTAAFSGVAVVLFLSLICDAWVDAIEEDA